MRNNMIGNIKYDLTPSGKCPICKTQIKIIDNEKSLYKGRSVWVHHDRYRVEAKCPKCGRILIDKKIA